MDLVARIFFFTAGLLLVVATLYSAVVTFVLPRSYNTWLTRQVFRGTWLGFRFVAKFTRRYEQEDRILALFAPVALLMLPIVWVWLVITGYTGMFWALDVQPWLDAFHASGSSLLTLGFFPVDTFPTIILAFSEAVLGLGLVALLIAYLPTIYSAFSRREAVVTLLEAYAGMPPSPIEMIARSHRVDMLARLADQWVNWENWFADIEESHTTFVALVFFRSPQSWRSWVTTAGVILDAAALMLSTVDTPRDPQAALCLRAGYLALRRIADFFDIDYDADPAPSDTISISRPEFDAAYDELVAAGVPVIADRNQAWRDYAGWRVNYDTVLIVLAGLTRAPYARWSSDRSLLLIQPEVKLSE
jgi:hypothetical protein